MAIVAAATLFTGQASAAGRSITVSPTSVDREIAAGESFSGELDVINGGTEGYDFKVYAAPYRVIGEAYEPGFTYLPGAKKVTDWFSFSQNSYSLNADQTLTVPYTVRVPENTPAGGYYAVVFAQTTATPSGSGVAVDQRVGEIFYIKVAGQVTEEGTVESWDVNPVQTDSLSGVIKIKNGGGSHFATDVNFVVKDILGNTKYEFKTKKYLLPQTIRRIDTPWKDSPRLGLFKVEGSVSILGKEYRLPSHYVLVASTSTLVILAIIGFICGVLLARKFHQRKTARANKDANATKT